jgi:hypothetical protein
MTEAEWLNCTDVEEMLKVLPGKTSDRKLRLFTCACFHTLDAEQPASETARAAIELAEQYLERGVADVELGLASAAARDQMFEPWSRPMGSGPPPMTDVRGSWMARMARWASCIDRQYAAMMGAEATTGLSSHRKIEPPDWSARSSYLLREIIGNPYRPLVTDSRWLSTTVVTLSRLAYDSRSFEALPILADALEDAGCGDSDILAHCRGPGPHVRGCWVVDLLLGKS